MFVKLYAWYRAAIFLNPHSHLHPCSNLSEPPYSSHVDCILLIYFHIHATLLLYILPNSLPLHGHATLDGILIAWTDWELYSSNILPRSCHSSSLSLPNFLPLVIPSLDGISIARTDWKLYYCRCSCKLKLTFAYVVSYDREGLACTVPSPQQKQE